MMLYQEFLDLSKHYYEDDFDAEYFETVDDDDSACDGIEPEKYDMRDTVERLRKATVDLNGINVLIRSLARVKLDYDSRESSLDQVADMVNGVNESLSAVRTYLFMLRHGIYRRRYLEGKPMHYHYAMLMQYALTMRALARHLSSQVDQADDCVLALIDETERVARQLNLGDDAERMVERIEKGAENTDPLPMSDEFDVFMAKQSEGGAK